MLVSKIVCSCVICIEFCVSRGVFDLGSLHSIDPLGAIYQIWCLTANLHSEQSCALSTSWSSHLQLVFCFSLGVSIIPRSLMIDIFLLVGLRPTPLSHLSHHLAALASASGLCLGLGRTLVKVAKPGIFQLMRKMRKPSECQRSFWQVINFGDEKGVLSFDIHANLYNRL